jgi:hypothetical protein
MASVAAAAEPPRKLTEAERAPVRVPVFSGIVLDTPSGPLDVAPDGPLAAPSPPLGKRKPLPAFKPVFPSQNPSILD